MSQARILADPREHAADAGGTDEDAIEMRQAIELGRESARTEPLLDDDDVFAMARDPSKRP
jgi:hypothetical protein